jgi:mannosyltransferase
VVFLVSLGQHSFFFPRFLLTTVAAWAVLAGIGLARLELRAAAAFVLAVGLLGAGDQQAIRELGAHNWAFYPIGPSGYPDFPGAARIIARDAKAGDGIAYPDGGEGWQMLNLGVQYYLERDIGSASLPKPLFLDPSVSQIQHLYPVFCTTPTACLGNAPRVWVVIPGGAASPYGDPLTSQAAALRANYRVVSRHSVPSLTVFLLVRD